MKRCIAISLLLCGLLHAEALSPECYRDNEKNVVICSEKKLGDLMWQDEEQSFKGTWDEAQEYCKKLSLAGYKDWRLPTRMELLSIAEKSTYNPAINKAFKNVAYETSDKSEKIYGDYWSSIKSAAPYGRVWSVFFGSGGEFWDVFSGRHFVRCVRED